MVSMARYGLTEGSTVVVYLQGPKEKVWGVLVSLTPSGVVLRGVDLETFDDWMRQEARGDETLIGPLTLFYPMHRIVRMERDETVGPLTSYADRFAREVGRTVTAVLGLEPKGS
jgi:hypothetical protein